MSLLLLVIVVPYSILPITGLKRKTHGKKNRIKKELSVNADALT